MDHRIQEDSRRGKVNIILILYAVFLMFILDRKVGKAIMPTVIPFSKTAAEKIPRMEDSTRFKKFGNLRFKNDLKFKSLD